jgi:hypothetical protein
VKARPDQGRAFACTLTHMRTLLLGLAAASLIAAVQAQTPPAKTAADLARLGPQIGDRAHDFSLPDQTGTARDLKSVLGPNGAMLVFFRSAEW